MTGIVPTGKQSPVLLKRSAATEDEPQHIPFHPLEHITIIMQSIRRLIIASEEKNCEYSEDEWDGRVQ